MDGECHEPPDSQGKRDSRTVWRRIATLAERQHGVVAGRQLLAAGLSAKAIEYQLRTARLHRVQRGVYAVGHRRLSREGEWMAAILAAPGAVLSHRSAAELWELRERRGGRIHVTGPRRLHPRSSLVAHLRLLPGDERTVHNGIPTTTVPRTLLDIAATEGRGPLTRALREAHFRRLGKPAAALALLVARYPRARGTRIAADVLAARAFTARTRSELEAAFLEFLAAEGIEPPETNVESSPRARASKSTASGRPGA